MIKIGGTGEHAHDKNERTLLYEDSPETKHYEFILYYYLNCGAKTDSFLLSSIHHSIKQMHQIQIKSVK